VETRQEKKLLEYIKESTDEGESSATEEVKKNKGVNE